MKDFFVKLLLGIVFTIICIGGSSLIYYLMGWEFDRVAAAGCLSVCAIMLHFFDLNLDKKLKKYEDD